MAQDAARRDFTLNALYADRHCTVYDPVNGLKDALEGRVRFIDDAAQRIREDYLRILRFFRFSAFYGQPNHGWNADALAAIAENLNGLKTLSAERVGSEMLRLLSASDPVGPVAVMERIGVLNSILPGADAKLLGLLIHIEGQIAASRDPITRLAALGGTDVVQRLRLSRKDQKQLALTLEHAGSLMGARAIGHSAGLAAGTGAILLRAALTEQPLLASTAQDIAYGAAMKFPVSARDLPELIGPALGKRLAAIKKDWLISDLTKTKADLLRA
jgi:tRNA nucleotidyltransferase/poly(A) polymerase